MNITKETL